MRAAIIWPPFVLTVSPSGLIWGHFGRRLWGPQPRRVRMEARRVGIQMRRVGLETRRVGTQWSLKSVWGAKGSVMRDLERSGR